MSVSNDDRQILAASKVWSSTPDNYSSLRSLWLEEDGSGKLIYGYGQTIYALIECRWEVASPGRLRLTYLESPKYQHFAGYTPLPGQNVRELDYTLTAEKITGVQDVVPNQYHYDHTLELSAPPWPAELSFPYEVPRIFYGKVVKE
jgi:hypothetical protein